MFGPRWFFWCITSAFGVVAGYLAWRLAFTEAMPRDAQKQFVPFPARAGYLAVAMMVEPVRTATRIVAGTRITTRRHRSRTAPAPAGDDSVADDPQPPSTDF